MRFFREAILSVILLVPSAVSAQLADPPPAQFERALQELAAGDTSAALNDLRELTSTKPDFGPAWLQLGALLSARASEVELNFAGRLEAKEVLERAVQLMPGDPAALLEYGLLLRKQQIRVDAERVLNRAWEAAEKRGESLSPLDRARLHYELGRNYETWWLDWEDLIAISPHALGGWSCPSISGAPLNTVNYGEAFATFAVACPHNWRTVLKRAVPLADLKSEERERMLDHFRLAHAADPGYIAAGLALLSHLVADQNWEEYAAVAERMEAAAPTEARVHLFKALGLHELGRVNAADSAFARALALLPAEDRRVFEDVALLLPNSADSAYATMDDASRAEIARRVFTARDPLHLTDISERRLEHYARLAWAELRFGAPASGIRGWDTERGQIWVRYGRPELHRQCCYAEKERWAYWSYGERGPNFAFKRAVTYRLAHMNEAAKRVADELSASAPEQYRLTTITRSVAMPHQVARFRGQGEAIVRVEIYGEVDTDSLELPPEAEVDAGLFVFDARFNRIWGPTSRRAGRNALHLGYSFGVAPGSYTFAIEARGVESEDIPRPLARANGSFDAAAFPPGRLAVSDILLAESISTDAPAPSTRKEMRIAARRSTIVPANEPLHLYFEMYGLTPGEDGLGKIRLELAVEDAEERNVARRLLRGMGELIRGAAEDATIQWERTVPLALDQALEYLTVELATYEAGDYRLRVRVTDLVSGQQADVVREFVIAPAE